MAIHEPQESEASPLLQLSEAKSKRPGWPLPHFSIVLCLIKIPVRLLNVYKDCFIRSNAYLEKKKHIDKIVEAGRSTYRILIFYWGRGVEGSLGVSSPLSPSHKCTSDFLFPFRMQSRFWKRSAGACVCRKESLSASPPLFLLLLLLVF